MCIFAASNLIQRAGYCILPLPNKHNSNLEVIANEISEIMAIDMNGRTIRTVRDTDRMTIDGLAKGCYIVRVLADGRVHYLKLIKD